jgi:uncharacterized protein YxeA
MKKILCRLIAIIIFCISSLLIKSENSMCKVTSYCIPPDTAAIKSALKNDKAKTSDARYESFFIKI